MAGESAIVYWLAQDECTWPPLLEESGVSTIAFG